MSSFTNSTSPKSTEVEHGSAKDSEHANTSTPLETEADTESESESESEPSTRRHSHDKGKAREQDHPTYRYTETKDAHEEFRAVGRPEMTRRESELAHIAAAQREIEKAEAHLKDPETDEGEGSGSAVVGEKVEKGDQR